MKKLLLPMAAALAALSASAITETPIMTYDYSTATETGLTTDYYSNSANPSSPVWSTIGGDTRYNNGMLFIASPNIADGTFNTLKQGISIQKMGGKVGNVLCINGATTSFNNATGFNAPEIQFNPFWNLNWLTDPNNTPVGGSAAQPKIRVRITFNVYNSSTAQVNIPKASYLVSNLGAIGTNDNSDDIGGLSTSNFVDEEGNWDSTKWCVYEFDTFCANEEGSTPARLKFEFSNFGKGITGRTLLIQKVEFFEISDYTADEINVGTRKVTYKTMNVNFGGEKEVEEEPVATPDQSKFTFGQVSVNPVAYDWTNNVISGSTANSFSVPVSVAADSRYVGYKAVYSGSVTGVWVNVANNKTSNFTITVPEVGTEAYNGYINFLPYTNTKKHTVAITSVTYSKEGEEDVTEDLSINETLGSSFSVSLGEINEVHYLVAANEDKSVLDLYAKYGFAVANSDDAVYVQYATTLNDETVESQVLTEAVEVEGTIFGFDNYTEGANWSSVAAQEGKLPILVEGVNNVGDEVKASVKLVYPFAWGAAFTEEVAESANDYTVALHQAATGEKTASITISEEEFDKATTGVANIAVAGNESVEYFNLQGVRVANPENGVFIRRQGGRASKVVLK